MTAIEKYYQTDNEWHNSHIVDLIADAIKEGFTKEELEPTILVYNETLNLFEANPKSPLVVIDKLNEAFQKLGFDEHKQYFCMYRAYRCLRGSTYNEEKIDPEDQEQFETVFKAYIDQLQANPDPVSSSSKPIAQTLKAIATDELSKLPELLNSLEAKDRVNFLMKILPYAAPKIDSVRHNTFDE